MSKWVLQPTAALSLGIYLYRELTGYRCNQDRLAFSVEINFFNQLFLGNVTEIPLLRTGESKCMGFMSNSYAIHLSSMNSLLLLGLQNLSFLCQVQIPRKRVEIGTWEFNNNLAV